MSWWSDNEKFDEHDPDYCVGCKRGFTKEECDRCMKRHEQEQTMSDLIKREDAINAVENVSENYTKEGDREWHPHIDFITQALVQVPSVSPKQGEWIPNPKIGWGETWVCSICGEKTTSSVMGKPRYRYCPWCGANMKGADDE